MAREASRHTSQAPALVHAAWLRLVGDPERRWEGRAHFFDAAAEATAVMGISDRTAKRHWVFARAWLFSELKPDCPR